MQVASFPGSRSARPHLDRIALVALVAAVMTGCRSVPEKEDVPLQPPPSFHLVFPPPTGKLFRQTIETSRTDGGDAKARTSQRTRVTETVRFDPIDAAAFRMTQQISEVVVDPKPEAPAAELLSLMTRFALEAELGRDGAFVRLLNPEDVTKAIRSGVTDPQLADFVSEQLSPEALEAQARREWEDRYGVLLGRPLQQGAVVDTVEQLTLGSGSTLAYGLERTVSGTRATRFGDALVFTIRCFGDAKTESRKLALEAFRARVPGAQLEPTATCEGEQVIAVTPFLPVTDRLHLEARPAGAPVAYDETVSTTTAE